MDLRLENTHLLRVNETKHQSKEIIHATTHARKDATDRMVKEIRHMSVKSNDTIGQETAEI